MSRTYDRLTAFTRGYALAMLRFNTHVIGVDDLADSKPVEPEWWQSNDEDWPIEAFEEGSRADLREDCSDFFKANLRELLAYAAIIRSRLPEWVTPEDSDDRAYRGAGTDFALTRNGHGAGFWDRGMPDGLAASLTAASKAYGGSQGWLSGDENYVSLQT